MSNTENILLNFLHFAEGLKNELRNGRTSKERRESVAEHTWRVSLMVILFSRFLDKQISLEKALKIAIIHDIAELITGDKPYFVYEGNKHSKQDKFEQEMAAMQYIKSFLPESLGAELIDLWKEYEDGVTYEAKLVKAIDKIEAQIQHNEMNYIHWNDYDKKYAPTRLDEYCNFDSFLTKIKTLIQEESMDKIASAQAT
ncbi:MAG TPA: HD domain-containing protein [Candidatus Babeliaceae bacterium]|nr:HD domain-containing protein [Candidatus Babeliaceae bacterium]